MLRFLMLIAFLAGTSAHAEDRPLFEDYAVPVVDTTSLADPIFLSGSMFLPYRERIEACAEAGINFAGRFTACEIPRGTSVQLVVVIDRISGAVNAITETRVGFATEADSELFIANPLEEGDTLDYRVEGEYPKYFTFYSHNLELEGIEE